MNKEQGFLLFVLAVATAASFLVILPIIQFVLMAIILAYILHPLNRRLEPYLGSHLTPVVVILAGIIALILPFLYVGYIVFRELQNIAAEGPDIEVDVVEEWVADVTGQQIELTAYFEEVGMGMLDVLFGDVTGILSQLAFMLIGVAIVLFMLYYLLRDGEDAVAWLVDVVPIDDRVAERLTEQIDKTTYGVIMGHLAVAIVQGIVGGIAFWFVGLPNVFFWAFVMVIASLLPIVGAFLVWAPGVGYLFLIGDFFGAAFLLFWGAIIISLIDDWLRPIVVDRGAQLNPAIILIGVFGGIYAIGATGIFVGPIILGVLIAAMRVFDDTWEDLGNVESEQCN